MQEKKVSVVTRIEGQLGSVNLRPAGFSTIWHANGRLGIYVFAWRMWRLTRRATRTAT